MSTLKSDLIPSSEMKTFMDELARVTDRESFNSLMKRFDDSFLQRYQSKPPSEPRAEYRVDPQPRHPAPSYPPAGDLYNQYTGNPITSMNYMTQYSYGPGYHGQPEVHRNYSEGRIPRFEHPNQARYYQDDFPRHELFDDPYRIPMYQRGPPVEKEHPGYIRTEYVHYPQPTQYAVPPSQLNNPNPIQSRNALQESMDLRRLKEELLSKAKPEPRIEEVVLPPPRYAAPNYETSGSYYQGNFKSFY